ncbi:hypothetical protein [Rothia nasimurium]|uniref:hypothetical protein n=1 Tax=Rothia nasimurium TaxID=85336 RepID=UPI002DD69AA5|nr:hypothetical protein [Rothia nasimurium]
MNTPSIVVVTAGLGEPSTTALDQVGGEADALIVVTSVFKAAGSSGRQHRLLLRHS